MLPQYEYEFPFAPTPAAPVFARRVLRDVIGDAEFDALLLTSELVTNAVLHGESPMHLAIDCSDSRLRVGVFDAGDGTPMIRESREGGRGLRLVAAISSRWGIERVEDDGKTVWFEIDAG